MPTSSDILIHAPLVPSEEAQVALDDTLRAFQAAIQIVQGVGRARGTSSNALLHHACYDRVRAECGLPANLAVRAIARAAYRLRGEERPALESLRSVGYDRKVASWSADGELTLSLSTVHGRLKEVPAMTTRSERRRLRAFKPRRGVLVAAPDGYVFGFYLLARVRPKDLALAEEIILTTHTLFSS